MHKVICESDRQLGYVSGMSRGVKGSLNKCAQYWDRVLDAPQAVLSIIRQGYILPFASVPGEKIFNNQSSAGIDEGFVTQSIKVLVDGGCEAGVRSTKGVQPTASSGGEVREEKTGDNLRYINAFVQKQRFKYEDSRTALSLIQKGDFMCTFDLKSGYHHIDIHKQSQTYLGFSWKGDYYIFTVLPFGLSTA